MRDVSEFRASKSSIYEFERTGICRSRWYEERVVKSVPQSPASDAMLKGIYFEILALGEDVRGSDLPDMSFLMTKKGEKTVELQRIEEQALRFKELFDRDHPDYLGFRIKGTQILVDDGKSKGVFDFIAEDDFGRDCLFDLKFTADVNGTFGDFAWGKDPERIDWTQQVIYKELYKKEFGVEPRLYVIVFDATPSKNIKMFELNISSMSVDEVGERVDNMLYAAQKYSESGAPVSPSAKNCEGCMVECMLKHQMGSVNTVKVSV